MDSVESFDDDFNEWYPALGGRNEEEEEEEGEKEIDNDGEGCENVGDTAKKRVTLGF